MAGCMTTKVAFDKNWNPSLNPSYEDYFNFYALGFAGHPSLSLQEACVDQKPYGMISQRTFEDSFIAALTLGIYTPATVRVWCGD